jgi:ribonuclease D
MVSELPLSKQQIRETHMVEVSPPHEAPVWVATPEALALMLAQLRHSAAIAVDTESDSLYSYYEKVCLIQFSIPGTDYLVDPLRALDLSPLSEIFADPQIQKVFHAAEYDLLGLKRDYGFSVANLFDTMIAARILGWRRLGLASILKERFSVVLDKRWQRYNWGLRPLSREAMEYARLDTYYLLPLRDRQLEELQARRRLKEATEAFARRAQVHPVPRTFDPDGFWSLRGAYDLSPPGRAVLRELYIYRDRQARARNLPPFKVLTNSTLVHLAEALPRDLQALSRVKGMTPYLLRREATGLLAAIARGLKRSPPRLPRHDQSRRPDEATLLRYEALRQWRKGVAEERGVEPDVILSNGVLMRLARQAPETLAALQRLNVLGEWQYEMYGSQVLAVLRKGR